MTQVRSMGIVLSLALVGSVAIIASQVAMAGSITTREGGRISGADRISTAVAISNQAFPQGASTVFIATADGFADALAAGSLTDGPVLLVPQCGELPIVVANEIDRLDPQRVLALGGESAVANQILRQAVSGQLEPGLSCPGATATSQAGVGLAAREDGDRAILSVVNSSPSTVEIGDHYVLERFDDGGFDPLQPVVGPFSEVARQVLPGETSDVATIGPMIVQGGEQRPLTPGRYRAIKVVAGHRLAVEFAIN